MTDATKPVVEHLEPKSVGDALEAAGFGRVACAMGLKALAESLRGKPTYSRILLETLRECGRHLRTSYEMNRDESDYDESNPDVMLVHQVARPARETQNAEARDRQIGFQFDKEKA